MTAPASVHAPNPLVRFAEAIPAPAAVTISIIARFVGAGFALYYAYDQDVLFPDRHFPRTWLMSSVVAAVAVLSTLPLPARGERARWLVVAFGAMGAGMLIFGGANLANKLPGIVVLVSGVIAVFALAVAASNRREPNWAVVAGLAAAAVATFALAGLSVVALSGSA